ncbi:hypothetical protein KY284_032178 [Solanum tuberosum]|nr:hypothetical protein KY284_032178 [Solanum tuberosum]
MVMQEELDKLESYGEASIVCKEFISVVESKPDALLPVTKGPVDVKWDRWFQRANGSKRLFNTPSYHFTLKTGHLTYA